MPGPEVAVKARAPFHDRADDHADGGELVFGLDNAKFLRPVSGSTRMRSQKLLKASISEVEGVIGYQAPTVAPAYMQPSAGGGVAVDDDVAARGVHLLDAQRQRAAEVLLRVVVAELDRLHVAVDQLRLLGVGFGEQLRG